MLARWHRNSHASMNRTPAAAAALDAEGEQPDAPGAVAAGSFVRERVVRLCPAAPGSSPSSTRGCALQELARPPARCGNGAPCAACSVSMPCRISHAFNGDSAAPKVRIDLHARLHRVAEVAEGLVELHAVIAAARLGHLGKLAVVPVELARSRRSRRPSSCRGRRGTWSRSARRCRRRSANGLHRYGDGDRVVDDQRQAVLVRDRRPPPRCRHVDQRVAERLGVDGAWCSAGSRGGSSPGRRGRRRWSRCRAARS